MAKLRYENLRIKLFLFRLIKNNKQFGKAPVYHLFITSNMLTDRLIYHNYITFNQHNFRYLCTYNEATKNNPINNQP